jgi:hypothetical protein
MKGYWDGFFIAMVAVFVIPLGTFTDKLIEYGSLRAAFEAWELRDWRWVLVFLGTVILFGLAFGWVPVRLICSRRRK